VPLIVRWPKGLSPPTQIKPGAVDDRIVSLIDVTAATLTAAGLDVPEGMQGRTFLGPAAGEGRPLAFAARDRIDETAQRIRSVHDKRYHYIRTFTSGPTFASLNRYKEKCFPVVPLMRDLHAAGKLAGPPRDLMERSGPCEELYDLETDPHEVKNLVDSQAPEHREALAQLRAALETWIVETGDRGAVPEPAEVIAPFEKEMHDWFGTPAWYRKTTKD
jgi:N-sulfoglucosamine sulfohydrolase